MAFIENAPEQIVAAAKELLEKGLVEGTSGNILAWMEDGNIAVYSFFARLPAAMTVDDIVIVNPAGDVVSGERGPTSEKYLHLAAMNAYEDIAVCIHSHAVYATMFAVAHQDIPSCIDESTVYLGGDIRCTEYCFEWFWPSWPSRSSRPSRAEVPRSSPTTGWWPSGRPCRRRCTTPLSWSARPRSSGGPSSSAASSRCPRRSTRTSARDYTSPPMMSEGRICSRLAELGLRLHGPHPPHDPLDAGGDPSGRGAHIRPASPDRRRADCVLALGRHRDGGGGSEAAAVCALTALAVLEQELGSLDRALSAPSQ